MKLSIRFNLDPALSEFFTSVWTPQNGRDMIQIVENELAVNNFPNVWRSFQGTWAPLSPRYDAWKKRNFPGRKKWELTGAALDSLGTPVNLDVTGGHVKHKHIYIGSPRSGVTTATYQFRSPAAGGYFERNNQSRPIWLLLDGSRDVIMKNGYAYLGSLLKAAGWK